MRLTISRALYLPAGLFLLAEGILCTFWSAPVHLVEYQPLASWMGFADLLSGVVLLTWNRFAPRLANATTEAGHWVATGVSRKASFRYRPGIWPLVLLFVWSLGGVFGVLNGILALGMGEVIGLVVVSRALAYSVLLLFSGRACRLAAAPPSDAA